MEYLYKIKKNNRDRGFVIMVAVVVSALLISIGAFISVIALKEIQISSSSKNSQTAFYAADSALECALFHDIRIGASGGPFPANSTDVANMGVTLADTVACNSFTDQEPIVIWHDGNIETADQDLRDDIESDIENNTDANSAVSYFEVSFRRPQKGEELADAPYARVRIEKIDNIPSGAPDGFVDTISIKAYGHNKKEGTGVVERSLEVNY